MNPPNEKPSVGERELTPLDHDAVLAAWLLLVATDKKLPRNRITEMARPITEYREKATAAVRKELDAANTQIVGLREALGAAIGRIEALDWCADVYKTQLEYTASDYSHLTTIRRDELERLKSLDEKVGDFELTEKFHEWLATFGLSCVKTDELEELRKDKIKLGRLVLNETTRDILGRPGFTVRDEAHLLRDSGYATVAKKTEDEQAVALFWMLMLYVEHGEKWREVGGEEVRTRIAAIERTKP